MNASAIKEVTLPSAPAEQISPRAIQTVQQTHELAVTHPGFEIQGFGQLPKVKPLENPQLAYRADNAELDPHTVQKLLALEKEFRGESLERQFFDPLSMQLLHMLDAPYHLTEENVREIVGFHKARLKQVIADQYPTLIDDFHHYVDTRPQRLRLRKELEEAKIDVDLMKFENDEEFRKRFSTEKDFQEFLSMHRSYSKEKVEEKYKKYDRNSEFLKVEYAEGLAIYARERYGLDGEATYDAPYENNIVQKLAIESVGEIFWQFREKMREIGYSIRYSGSEIFKESGEGGLQAHIRRMVQDRFPENTQSDSFRESLVSTIAEKVQTTFKSKGDFDASYDEIENFSTEIITGGRLPLEYILHAFETQTVRYQESLQPLTGTNVDFYRSNLFVFHDRREFVFDQYIDCQLLKGMSHEDVVKLKKAEKLLQNSRENMSDKSHSHSLVFSHGLQYQDGTYGTAILNDALVNPALPSQEALSELRTRQESVSPDIDPEFETYWQITSRIAKRYGVEPEEWYHWALATKKPGLSGLARGNRRELVRNLLTSAKKPQDILNEQFQGPHLDDFRLPDQDEIWEGLNALQHNRHVTSQYDAYKALRLAIPVARTDMEEGWGKYKFSPKEWVDLYADVYNVIKADYFHDNSPYFLLCQMRSSLVSVYAGQHEQYHKGRSTPVGQDKEYFDELDALLFLPVMIRNNEIVRDSGAVMLAMRLVLQMDDSMRVQYHDVILHCLEEIYKTSLPSKKQNVDFSLLDDSAVPSTDLTINMSTVDNKIDQLTERALARARAGENVHMRLDRRGYMTVEAVDEGTNKKTKRVLTKDEVQRARELKRGAVIEGKEYTGMYLENALEFLYGGDGATLRFTSEHDENGIPSGVYGFLLHADKWKDEDVFLHPETGELTARNKDMILPNMASAIERARATQSGEFVKALEALNRHENNSDLRQIATAADIVTLLTGKELPVNDVSEMIAGIHRVIRIASQLRKAGSRAEVAELLSQLDRPVTLQDMSFDGIADMIWQASGYLEREAVIRDTIQAVAASYRISFWRIANTVEDFQRQEYAKQLEQDLGVSPEEARMLSEEDVGWQFYAGREELVKEAPVLQRALLESRTVAEYKIAQRKFRTSLISKTARVMQDISRITDYDYSSTHWLQVMDQIIGKDGDGNGYLESDGRLRMYCVQTSYILYEMLHDLYAPLDDVSFHKPAEITIAFEDEFHGMTLAEYYEAITQKREEVNSFDHFHVLVALPQLTEQDTRYYALCDQTENTIRVVSEDNIVKSADGREFIINNSKAQEITSSGIRRKKDKGETRIVSATGTGDQSLSMVAQIMRGFDPLKDYVAELSGDHPVTNVNVLTDRTMSMELKLQALMKLVKQNPYFIGLSGFYKSELGYLSMINNVREICARSSMPIYGLFASRTSNAFIGTNPEESEQVLSFRRQCSYMSDKAWQTQLQEFGALLHPDDASFIDKKREELRLLDEAKRKELEERERQEAAERAARISASMFEVLQQMAREQNESKPVEEKLIPGSKERLLATQAAVDRHAETVNDTFSTQAPLLPEKIERVEVKQLDSQQLMSEIIKNPPLELKPETAEQAARWLLSQFDVKDEAEREKMFEFYSALHRATVTESRRDKTLRRRAWNTFNASFARQLELSGIDSADGMPFGTLLQLLERSPENVRASIRGRMKEYGQVQMPNTVLLSSQAQ